jgi:hypothetical protein
MSDRFVKLSEANAPVVDTASIPFTSALSIIADHIMHEPLAITPNTVGAVMGYGTIQRIIADGVNIPDTTAFKTLATSYAYNNVDGAVNLFIFFFDGTSYNVAITQNGEIVTPTPTQLVTTWAGRLATAGYTLSSPRQSAYIAFITTLVNNGLYGLITEMWLMEGGLAATNILGFKNIYNAIANGTLSYSTNGITGDGSTGYFDLGLTPSTIGTGNMHMAVYGLSVSANNGYLIGSTPDSSHYTFMSPRVGTNYFGISDIQLPTASSTTTKGRFILSRNGTQLSLSNNGVFTDYTGSSAITVNTNNLYLLALNDNGTIDSFSNQQIGFTSVGLAFTDAQATIFDTALSTLFAALGR